MSPNAKASNVLLYVGDQDADDVFVYNFKSGKYVGTLTGFEEPYGECVDAKGDIYVANFDGGNAFEYVHGGTKVLQTYDSGGEPIGCLIDSKGDVAVTSFIPSEVTVFAKSNPNKGTTYRDNSCEFLWTMGYDDKGNLVGDCENASGTVEYRGLLSGAKSITPLAASGFAINYAGGTTWDGKYLVLADQKAGGNFQTGLVRANLKGTTLTYVSETVLSDDCYNNYVDVIDPFIVGETNTLFYGKQGDAIVGANFWCAYEGSGKVDYWHYPEGELPYKHLASSPANSYGAGVSFAP
jgi:hypothetical protein